MKSVKSFLSHLLFNLIVPLIEYLYNLYLMFIKYYHKQYMGKLISHRGILDNLNIKENTLEACNNSLNNGFNGVEIDVHLSKDYVVVVNHDSYLINLDKQKYYINEHSFEELKRCSSSLISLRDILDNIANYKNILFIEIKKQGTIENDKNLTDCLVKIINDCSIKNNIYLICSELKLIDLYLKHKLNILPIITFNRKKVLNYVIKNNLKGILGHYILMTNKFLQRIKKYGLLSGCGVVKAMRTLNAVQFKQFDFIVSEINNCFQNNNEARYDRKDF